MAKYKITDNTTGKVVTISGDHQPSEMEAEQIFKDAGLRSSTPSTPTQPQGLSYQQGDNPLLYAAAKAQEVTAPAAKVFGETNALPVAGGIAGSFAGPLGAGLGASLGEGLKQTFKPQEADKMKVLTTGLKSAATAQIFNLIFKPFETVGGIRNFFANKNPDIPIYGDAAAKAVTETFENMPAEIKTTAVEKAYQRVMSDLTGKIYNTAEALAKKTAEGNVGYLSSGMEARPAIAEFARAIQKSLADQLHAGSAGLGVTDDIFSALYRAKNAMKLPLRIGVGAGMGTAVGSAVGKLMGR